MRFQYRFDPPVCPITQREAGVWCHSTQPTSQYHPVFQLSPFRAWAKRSFLRVSADSAVFEIYIEQILAPSLHAGQIVILDNLSTHTGEKVRQVIEARGCQLLFLPSYSPDLSPIEEAFSKLKAFLRQVGARTPETDAEKRLGKHFSLLLLTMLMGGFAIAAICLKTGANSSWYHEWLLLHDL